MALLAVLAFGALTFAQTDDRGNPNDPATNPRANACFVGGSLEGKCSSTDVDGDGAISLSDISWMWEAGWYLIRYQAGIISEADFPLQFIDLLPRLEEIIATAVEEAGDDTVTPPSVFSAGCYRSTLFISKTKPSSAKVKGDVSSSAKIKGDVASASPVKSKVVEPSFGVGPIIITVVPPMAYSYSGNPNVLGNVKEHSTVDCIGGVTMFVYSYFVVTNDTTGEAACISEFGPSALVSTSNIIYSSFGSPAGYAVCFEGN
jgi:hypothetical protein